MLPEPVEAVARAYLEEVDGARPGLVEGCYATGSVALGAFDARVSDVDLVAVTREPLGDAERAALTGAHGRLDARRPAPPCSAVYLTWDDLRTGPPERAWTWLDGELRARENAANPVEFLTLATRGLAFRGPAPATLGITVDRPALAAWNIANLESYWAGLADAVRQAPVDEDEPAGGDGAVVAWMVLGPPRLHYTVATGEVTSKVGAGEYVLACFPERWHRLAREALRARRGDGGPSLYARRADLQRDVVAFVAWVVADARRLACEA